MNVDMAARLLMPSGVRGLEFERVILGGNAGIEAATELVRATTGSVSGELFAISKGDLFDAFVDQAKAGKLRLASDPETFADSTTQALIKAGGDIRSWGGNALRDGEFDYTLNNRKIHAKVLHTPEHSWLSTAAWRRHGDNDSRDITFIVDGSTQAAKAARMITRATHNGSDADVVFQAQRAREHGVLLNDAALGVTHLTDGYMAAINGADHELVIMSKVIDDLPYAEAIAAAQRRGVKVHLIMHPVKSRDPRVYDALQEVDIHADPYGVLHGNVVIADGKVAVVGSAHGTPRALGHPARRDSHELGMVTDDADTVAQIREYALSTPGMKAQPIPTHWRPGDPEEQLFAVSALQRPSGAPR